MASCIGPSKALQSRTGQIFVVPSLRARARSIACERLLVNGVATVVANRACSLDESVRVVTLSIHEDVEFIEGLRMPRKPAQPRWVDNYKVPGQIVDVQFNDAPPFSTPIASSPCASKAASADISATMIEVVATSDGKTACLMSAAPGDQLAVGEVRGLGFAGVITPEATLSSALEEKCPIVMLACGAEGIAPIRCALEWAPLQAHASEAPVVLAYVARSMASAAFLADWDAWREMGVTVLPLYLEPPVPGPPGDGPANGARPDAVSVDGDGAPEALSEEDRMILAFESALFSSPKRWQELTGGKGRDTLVLMSGLPGPVSAALVRFLSNHRVQRERMLTS